MKHSLPTSGHVFCIRWFRRNLTSKPKICYLDELLSNQQIFWNCINYQISNEGWYLITLNTFQMEHITCTLNKDWYSKISLSPFFFFCSYTHTALTIFIANYDDALTGSVMNHSLYAITSYTGYEQTTFIKVASSSMYKWYINYSQNLKITGGQPQHPCLTTAILSLNS